VFRLFFPLAGPYLIMEFAYYLNYRGKEPPLQLWPRGLLPRMGAVGAGRAFGVGRFTIPFRAIW
jgi:hypothetical protein